MVRVAGRQRAPAGAVHVGRDVERADQLDGGPGRAGRPHLAAEQDGGLLGVHQEVGELLDGLGVPGRPGGGTVGPGPGHPRLLRRHPGVQHVARDLQEGRPRSAVVALAERHRHHVRGARGVRHGRRELGDRRHHVDVRQVLERAHLVLGVGALAADQQHGRLGAEGVGDPGDGVGGAGARGDHRAAGLAGDSGVSVGGVRGDLLVAYVDDLDALVDAAVVDVDDVAAAQRVDAVDPLGLECLGNEVAAGDDVLGVVGHGEVLSLHEGLGRSRGTLHTVDEYCMKLVIPHPVGGVQGACGTFSQEPRWTCTNTRQGNSSQNTASSYRGPRSPTRPNGPGRSPARSADAPSSRRR